MRQLYWLVGIGLGTLVAAGAIATGAAYVVRALNTAGL